MRTCNATGCQENHIKFDDCIAEALYEWSMQGDGESTGTTEFRGHFTLFEVANDEIHPWEHEPSRKPINVEAGWYILASDDHGFVTGYRYSKEDARRLYDEEARLYDEWDSEE